LRMITSYSQLLIKMYPTGGEGQQSVFTQRIVDGTTRMRKLLSDLLTYAEVSAAASPSKTIVNPNDTLPKCLDNLRATIESTGASITSETLPTLHADEAHLLSLFQNLIGNALKYRSGTPPEIHVSVSTAEGGHWLFGVADNGIGI